MSMFMASMRQAARDGELDGLGMFGAALKQDVAEYERRLALDRLSASPPHPSEQSRGEGE